MPAPTPRGEHIPLWSGLLSQTGAFVGQSTHPRSNKNSPIQNAPLPRAVRYRLWSRRCQTRASQPRRSQPRRPSEQHRARLGSARHGSLLTWPSGGAALCPGAPWSRAGPGGGRGGPTLRGTGARLSPRAAQRPYSSGGTPGRDGSGLPGSPGRGISPSPIPGAPGAPREPRGPDGAPGVRGAGRRGPLRTGGGDRAGERGRDRQRRGAPPPGL